MRQRIGGTCCRVVVPVYVMKAYGEWRCNCTHS